jgi:nicotinamide-nucleotide amidase
MKPAAAVLSIGNEILRGTVVNTNAAFLGAQLSGFGFEVAAHAVAPDSVEAIRFQLGELMRRSDVIITCGGIGPTPDDVTREGIAAHFNVPLVFLKDEFRRIEGLYKKFGKRPPALVKKEACFPRNAKPLLNRFGVAFGFVIEQKGKIVITLPGVPDELQNMYFDVVLPLLRKRFPKAAPAHRLVVKMTGIPEPDVMIRLKKDFFDDPFDFGIYPETGEVSIRIYCDDVKVIARLKRKIQARLHDFIYAWEDASLSQTVGDLLKKKKLTLSVAESCTGGLLASEIARYAGASAFFKGGTVAYHHEIKEKLGVSPETIKSYGEVSPQVAGELARSVRTRMNTDYGIGITGIAGPDGGTRKKPVGLVYIGLAGPKEKVRVSEHLLWGDRNQIQRRAVVKALGCLWRSVR